MSWEDNLSMKKNGRPGLTTDEFIRRSIEKHGDYCDYSLVVYKELETPVSIICHTHGEFKQKPAIHLRAKFPCPKCIHEKNSKKHTLTTEEFVERCIIKHGDRFDYSKTKYKNSSSKAVFICKDHGEFTASIRTHLNGNGGCSKCINTSKINKTSYFITKSIERHGNKYNYDESKYVGGKSSIKIFCNNCNSYFNQIAANHVNGANCPNCVVRCKPKTTEQFILEARNVYGGMYDYSLVDYITNHHKVNIICKEHGVFNISSIGHIGGRGCPICSRLNTRLSKEHFIEKANKVHNNKFGYNRVVYDGIHNKVEIYCPDHDGYFLQEPHSHLKGNACLICSGRDVNYYTDNNLCSYVEHRKRIGLYENTREGDRGVLEVSCKQCHHWFVPSRESVRIRYNAILGKRPGECNLYCSDECKEKCDTFGQQLYPKSFKPYRKQENQRDSSDQSAFRQRILDEYGSTCEVCGKSGVAVDAHHEIPLSMCDIDIMLWDVDNGVVVCKYCHHKKLHVGDCSPTKLSKNK